MSILTWDRLGRRRRPRKPRPTSDRVGRPTQLLRRHGPAAIERARARAWAKLRAVMEAEAAESDCEQRRP